MTIWHIIHIIRVPYPKVMNPHQIYALCSSVQLDSTLVCLDSSHVCLDSGLVCLDLTLVCLDPTLVCLDCRLYLSMSRPYPGMFRLYPAMSRLQPGTSRLAWYVQTLDSNQRHLLAMQVAGVYYNLLSLIGMLAINLIWHVYTQNRHESVKVGFILASTTI